MASTEGDTKRWECRQRDSAKSVKLDRKFLCAQKGYLRLFVFLLLITGSSQQIILDSFSCANNECSDGGVVDGSQVIMSGLVIADGTKPRVFTFYKRRTDDATSTAVCTKNADRGECDGQSAAPCYCEKVTGNTYRLVYKMTAHKQDSNAILTLGYDGDRSSGQQLPTVHEKMGNESSNGDEPSHGNEPSHASSTSLSLWLLVFCLWLVQLVELNIGRRTEEIPQTTSAKSAKMGKKVPCAHKGYFRLFVFFILITGSTQEIILQASNSSNARCSDGSVVDGKAQVVMVGLVVADGTKPREFTFYKRRIGDANTAPVCKINADTEKCNGQLATPCYCQGKTGNTYRVVYNMTADKQDSNAILTLGYDGDRSSEQHLPKVHIAERVRVTIAEGGYNIPFSSICSHTFSPGRAYAFTICGENLEGAEFYIGTDEIAGPWKTAINNCWSFSVTLETAPLIFAYRETQACLRTDSENCTLSERGEPDEACDTACVIAIITTSVVGVLVICAVILVVYYLKKHRKPFAGSQLTGRSVSLSSLSVKGKNDHTFGNGTQRENEVGKKHGQQEDDDRNCYVVMPQRHPTTKC